MRSKRLRDNLLDLAQRESSAGGAAEGQMRGLLIRHVIVAKKDCDG